MFNTFNMGVGMCVVVAAGRTRTGPWPLLRRPGEDAYVIGRDRPGRGAGGAMLKARIAVLVSGGGTNLQALLDAQAAGALPSGGDRAGGLQQGRAPTPWTRAKRGAASPLRGAAESEPDARRPLSQAILALLADARHRPDRPGGLPVAFWARTSSARYAGPDHQRPPLPDPLLLRRGLLRAARSIEAALDCGVKVTGATVHSGQRDPRRRADPAAKGGGGPARRHAGDPAAPGDGAGGVGAAAPGGRSCLPRELAKERSMI